MMGELGQNKSLLNFVQLFRFRRRLMLRAMFIKEEEDREETVMLV